jgi:EpsI family protein
VRTRTLIVAALVLIASAYVRLVSATAAPVARTALDQFPITVGEWEGQALPPLDAATARVLGADEYLNRRYVGTGSLAVDLFVAYYGSQQHGDAIHSPRNCLPGSGWAPVEASTTTLSRSGTEPIAINRYVIEKGSDRRVVFYWYQGRDRVVTNEYANKAWLVMDAIRSGRTDGGLVRILARESAAGEREALAFAAAALEPLRRSLP